MITFLLHFWRLFDIATYNYSYPADANSHISYTIVTTESGIFTAASLILLRYFVIFLSLIAFCSSCRHHSSSAINNFPFVICCQLFTVITEMLLTLGYIFHVISTFNFLYISLLCKYLFNQVIKLFNLRKEDHHQIPSRHALHASMQTGLHCIGVVVGRSKCERHDI